MQIKGTKWYWRQGLRQTPIHSYKDMGSACKTLELYMPVKSEEQLPFIIKELNDSGILVSSKKTHSDFDVVPAGSLIIFAAKSLSTPTPDEERNIKLLEKYISEHGGNIVENVPKKSIPKNIFSFFYGGRR